MYLVVGAGGFLGSYVIKNILEKTYDPIIAVSKNGQVYAGDDLRVKAVKLDVCNADELSRLISTIPISAKVVWLAAQHNIDKVAQAPEDAAKINLFALSTACAQLTNISRFIFTSSDTVYGEGGEKRFKETDELNPISEYGRQKLEGEKIVLSHNMNVVRLPFMFGKSISPYKKHFCDLIISNLELGQSTKMFTDSIRSTLSFDTVAKIIVSLCEEDEDIPPVLNIGADEPYSKYDVGVALAHKLGADTALITPEESRNAWAKGAERAVSTVMDNTLLKKTLMLDKITLEL